MKIPEQIRIAGVDFNIAQRANLRDGPTALDGMMDPNWSTITLFTGQDAQAMGITLWHEIIHRLIDVHGIKTDDEENLCRGMAHGIYQVLQDNARRLYDIAPD